MVCFTMGFVVYVYSLCADRGTVRDVCVCCLCGLKTEGMVKTMSVEINSIISQNGVRCCILLLCLGKSYFH